ncbi:E3 ubiquitin-protein ligase MARCHF7 isoform X1 [Echinops telfairi]|uniref:E3 ubiquitin-protein ligase MARCHF7 isoform X1 n=1 Tax=Echinops telfairi TaxID=9371 RepID=A0AC59C6U7_ECHTE|nr:E3 ubiquitin-protein ligase MARCHF7 isoform X1 [Echinops telfairi]
MESKPSRIPRRISVQPSSSLSARIMSGSRGSSLNDTYHSRDSSHRLDSEYQSTSASASPFQSAWYSESEITQGARSRSQNQQRDHDSKRPKLSCTNCSSTSAGRNVGSGLNAVSDSSWRHSQVPRSSSMVLGSFGTDLMRERRDLERRSDSSINNLMDYSHRSGDFTTSQYVQDRVPSYSQGARPKENSVSTLQLNTSSTNHHLPSEHQSVPCSRDSSRSSFRSHFSQRELESPRSSTQSAFSYISSRDDTPTISSSERVASSQRSFQEPSDNDGRRTTRRLLSRIASSMSSTFFSRRSSQDSLNTRSVNSENSYISPRVLPSQTRSNTASTSEVSDNRASETSQGFRFLRRRWGLSSLGQNHSSEPDSESFNQESEGRHTGPWLSSSLRNRCTPLFSRRRREGRDESSRLSTSDIPSRSHHIFRREANEVVHLEAQNDSLGATAHRPQASATSGSAATGASASDSAHSVRNSGITGILPGSLFRFAVPPALGSHLTDNVMITVDIIPSGWNSSDGKSDKTKSAPSRDPEKLQKIKESLLLEDSEEEEGDLCRICQMAAASSSNLLIEPCKCTGSLQYVHQECMKKWLQAKINSGSSLEAVTTCELCKEKLQLNLEDFDIHELHRAHANEQAEYEFISSGLYLVVLLHLCEQSFSDMMGNTNEPSTRVRLQRMILKKMETITEHLILPNFT